MDTLPDDLVLTALLPALPPDDIPTWRSLLATSRRFRRLAKSPTLPIWGVLDTARFEGMWGDASDTVSWERTLSVAHQLPLITRRCGLYVARSRDLFFIFNEEFFPPKDRERASPAGLLEGSYQ